MKVDLHVHSKFSRRPSEWILKKLECPESFTEPMHVYRTCRQRGMSLVTITDHNTIDGCLEIAHLPDVFVSEEVTTYFPDDGCKLHVLVYNIDEKQHLDVQKARENVFDLVALLWGQGICRALAHPLYSVNGKLTFEHFLKCLLLFQIFELNGARSDDQNRTLKGLLPALTQERIEQLIDEYQMTPLCDRPWIKAVVGGSDDHSSLTIGMSYTQVQGERDRGVNDFLRAIEEGQATVSAKGSTPKALARTLYSVAYQFYEHKCDLRKPGRNGNLVQFLDKFLRSDTDSTTHGVTNLGAFRKAKKLRWNADAENSAVFDMLQKHIHRSILDDPGLLGLFGSSNGDGQDLDQKWFQLVNQVSNKVLQHTADQFTNSFLGANFFNLFQALGSAGALYCALAPYFISFSIYAQDRYFATTILRQFQQDKKKNTSDRESVKIAHFTDTFSEVNGVAGTLRRQIQAARRSGKDYTVLTCDAGPHTEDPNVRMFPPIGVHELSVYPEQKLYFPPFLEMVDYCYRQRFTHLHAATPGPLGIAALAIARILHVPCVGTYHTALPQYAQYLTDDMLVGEMMWRYVTWFYDQMDMVYVPSRATRDELTAKGIASQRLHVLPRGVDTVRFHPSKRNGYLDEHCTQRDHARLLYVGRVSKEKNLELLVKAFRALVEERGSAYLVVVGDGPYRESMEKALEGTPSVFLGYRDGEALASIYASCDLFVFPSVTDTFGNVVLEAQASGLPVVVTDRGGPQENVLPDQTGIVVEGNSVASLLEGIRALISDPDRLKIMGSAARNYAAHRHFDTAFDEAWKLYRQAPHPCAGGFPGL
jgi:glycosyltransferase involved in cell wall biosynthesis